MSHNQTINETPIPFRYAVIPMLVMIIVMGICVIVLKASPHVPLLIGTATAAFIASRFGYTWNFIEEACYAGIKMALPAILIIIMIGLTIGSWIGGGIVATMVYYGLELLSPSMFLFTICSICCIVTLAIGSSWATMGTIGVAAMGIGHSIDIPAPMVAGAVISGAYFGDKMSPLSDTTNLAAGITGTLRAISTMTLAGTSSSQGEMTKLLLSAPSTSLILAASRWAPWNCRPIT